MYDELLNVLLSKDVKNDSTTQEVPCVEKVKTIIEDYRHNMTINLNKNINARLISVLKNLLFQHNDAEESIQIIIDCIQPEHMQTAMKELFKYVTDNRPYSMYLLNIYEQLNVDDQIYIINECVNNNYTTILRIILSVSREISIIRFIHSLNKENFDLIDLLTQSNRFISDVSHLNDIYIRHIIIRSAGIGARWNLNTTFTYIKSIDCHYCYYFSSMALKEYNELFIIKSLNADMLCAVITLFNTYYKYIRNIKKESNPDGIMRNEFKQLFDIIHSSDTTKVPIDNEIAQTNMIAQQKHISQCTNQSYSHKVSNNLPNAQVKDEKEKFKRIIAHVLQSCDSDIDIIEIMNHVRDIARRYNSPNIDNEMLMMNNTINYILNRNNLVRTSIIDISHSVNQYIDMLQRHTNDK